MHGGATADEISRECIDPEVSLLLLFRVTAQAVRLEKRQDGSVEVRRRTWWFFGSGQFRQQQEDEQNQPCAAPSADPHRDMTHRWAAILHDYS
jgi:hypothetical protein